MENFEDMNLDFLEGLDFLLDEHNQEPEQQPAEPAPAEPVPEPVLAPEAGRPREKREAQPKGSDWQKSLLLYAHDLLYLLAGLIVLMMLLPVVVVSGTSMTNTLQNGDYLLILSNIFYREPKYGDIIVASKDTFDNGSPIVKRVIATEGQTVDIDFDAGIVYVDGVALEEPYTRTATNIQEGVSFPLTVEEGCVFVMGDNRNGSRDSRYPGIGLIDKREIRGKVIFLFLPGRDDTTGKKDFGRIGVIG